MLLMIGPLSATEPIVEFAEAIEKGEIKTVLKMLADGLDPNTRVPGSSLDYTPLFLAVQSPHPAITEALLKAGADPTLEDENGDPVMVYASDAGRADHARLLIQSGVSIDSKNRRGITVLLRGAPYEEAQDLQAKIALGANVNLTDPEGYTALMIASRFANIAAMKVLIKAGAKLEISNKRDETALTLALSGSSVYSNREGAKNADLVKLLLEAGADVNRRNASGQSVLLVALNHWEITPEIIDVLLAAKPDIHVRDENGRTALHAAVIDEKWNDYIARLLALGADPMTTDEEGSSLLMRAAENCRVEQVRDFISRGLSATARNKAGQTAVHFASRANLHGHDDTPVKVISERVVAVLALLHKHGGSLTAADKERNTPLHLAALAGIPVVMSYLIPHYDTVEIQNAKGETPLHIAAAHGMGEAVERLLPGCKKIDLRDSEGNTALMNAMKVDHRWTFLELQKAGADIEAKDENGISSLAAALTANQFDKAKFLLENGADSGTLQNSNEELLRAAQLYHDEITSHEDYAFIIEFFGGLATDIDIRDPEGNTALMWVAASNNEAALKAILARSPEIDARSKDGRTALMWAACSRAIESMSILVAGGADESLIDSTGRSAAEWLAWTSAEHQSQQFQSKGLAALGERIIQSREVALRAYLEKGRWLRDDLVAGVPPLHLAAGLGDTDAIAKLLKLGATVGLAMTDGSTPLIEAAANGKLEAVKFLLGVDADPTLRDARGERAVDRAIGFGHGEVARFFLKNKIAFSNDESGLLTTLVYRGNEILLLEFFQAGARVLPPNQRDANVDEPFGRRALDPSSVLVTAAMRPSAKMLRLLMKFPEASGADSSDFQISALHKAAGLGRLENVRIFIEELKADPDALLSDSFQGVIVLSSGDSDDESSQPVKGFSALSRALEEGYPEVVRYLVKQGAAITGRTRGGEPPLTFVIKNRQDEMLRFFMNNDAPTELVDLGGQTALHRAAAMNHKLAVRLLLKHGADAKAKTSEGFTALDLARQKQHKEVVGLLEAALK